MDTHDTGRLAALGRRRRELLADLDQNRREIAPEVLAALRDGVPQVRVAEMSGYTREQVRRLARSAGIEAERNLSRTSHARPHR
jgi:hypothetical protein